MKISSIIIVILSILLVFSIVGNVMVLSVLDCLSIDNIRAHIAMNYLMQNSSCEHPEINDEPETIPEDTPPETETKEEEVEETEPEIAPLVLWDRNGVKITCLGLEPDGFYGPELNVLIENNTNKNIMISFNDVAINGYMLDPFWSTTITSGNKVLDEISWFKSDIDKCGIDSYKTIEGYFDIYDADSFNTLTHTPIIRINFE